MRGARSLDGDLALDNFPHGTEPEAVVSDRLSSQSKSGDTVLAPKAMIVWAIICLLAIVWVLLNALFSL